MEQSQTKVLAEFPRGRAEPKHPERGKQIAFGEKVYNEVMHFLIEEAAALDDNLWEDWLKFLAPDILYTMPIRQTVSRDDGQGFTPAMNWLYEDFGSIAWKAKRALHSDSAWAEDPPTRTRRLVTNVRLFETAKPDEYFAQSYILLRRNRGDAISADEISAKREDVIRRTGEGVKLAQRTVLADYTVMGMSNLAVFL